MLPQSLRVEIVKSQNSQTSSAHLHIKMSQHNLTKHLLLAHNTSRAPIITSNPENCASSSRRQLEEKQTAYFFWSAGSLEYYDQVLKQKSTPSTLSPPPCLFTSEVNKETHVCALLMIVAERVWWALGHSVSVRSTRLHIYH